MSADTVDDMTSDKGDNRNARWRAKNKALLVILLAFVALVYVISIVRMGGG
jgi:hypothetical protein